jgi:hypothetical protein
MTVHLPKCHKYIPPSQTIAKAELASRRAGYFAVFVYKGANRFSYLLSSINQRPLTPTNTPATTQNPF